MGVVAHIVFCHARTLLTKEQYASWRAIQDRYDGYMASLGPWEEADVVEHFALDYGGDDSRWPFSRVTIASFFAGKSIELELLEPSDG